MSKVVIVEHQGHQIDLLGRQVRRNGILKGPGESDDRRSRDAGFVELGVAIGQCERRRPRSARWRRRGRYRREIWAAIALRHGGGWRRLVRIARPALTINLAGGPDRAGQQLRRVATGGAEVERDDTWTDADEA